METLGRFNSWVFDCDGVLLDSNKVKTEAFRRAAEPYGQSQASALVDYHVRHGGISRYSKFETFLTDIVGRKTVVREELNELLAHYAEFVGRGLRECRVVEGLEELRALTRECRWLVASGGDQSELRALFEDRELAHLFDGGIFGSPDTKDDILSREIGAGSIPFPAVFVGDSQYDAEAASRANLAFIYASRWSESAYAFPEAILKVEGLDTLVECWEQWAN